MNINERLAALRKEMIQENIDVYIVPSSDPHNSEYVTDQWKSREWISGFTGSAGIVMITQDHAGVWTDSRYFLQAEDELADSEFVLHKVVNQFEPLHIKWILENVSEGKVIGFDGCCLPISQVDYLKNKCATKNQTLNFKHDLFSRIWTDRPELPKDEIFQHQLSFAGKSIEEKLSNIRSEMKNLDVEYHLVTTLDDIAWIFNIRGYDVECNPVCIAFALISESECTLFIDNEKVNSELKNYFQQNNIKLKEYLEIKDVLVKLNPKHTLLLDPNQCNFSLANLVKTKIQKAQTISRKLKAIKNDVEIGHFRTAMVKDGVALANTFYWLENELENSGVTEFELSEKLDEFRSKQEYFYGPSFPAIIGYKSNGAVIHYRPMPETSKTIQNDGVLLCDSGGQYQDGTTDITRTFCFSNPTEEFCKRYTAVLKGMIELTLAKFPKGTNGGQLDVLARKYLWEQNVNYLHGTGHGVGFFLNVHEAPQGFAPGNNQRAQTHHQPGMVTSNEPGFYKDGEYGIRIENLILTIDLDNGFYGHETITLYPIETKMILLDEMEPKHIEWLNSYHSKVEALLSPHLEEEQKNWLKVKCKSI